MSRINTGIELKDIKVTLEFTKEACYDMAYDIFRGLQRSCEKHWTNHGQSVFDDHEGVKLARMKMFFTLCGREDQYQDRYNELVKIIKEANDKNS